MTVIEYGKILTTGKPEKSLTKGFRRAMGRNAFGRITTRHKGGGNKRRYRDVDFKYEKLDIPYTVKTIEYDPNRGGFVGLVFYKDGVKRYVLLPQGVKVGDVCINSETAEIKIGNRLPLSKIPVGTFIYNVELKPKGGAKIARGAGNFIELIAKDAGYADLKMPSTEVRKVLDSAWATVGAVSNEEKHLVNQGKAGRNRWRGIRPTVRGTAMNPVDHPYGGGEGRQGRGLRRLKNVWGKPVGKGQKTRKPKKHSNIYIVSRRRVGKAKKGDKM